MPYSNPSSPAASSTASFVLPDPKPPHHLVPESASAAPSNSPATSYWHSTHPRSTLPRRASSTSPAPVKAVLGDGPGAGEVVSPPHPPGLILPRRTSHRHLGKEAKDVIDRKETDDTTPGGALGLRMDLGPASSETQNTIDFPSVGSPPALAPTTLPLVHHVHSSHRFHRPTTSSAPSSNIHSRRANPSNPASLRVDIPSPNRDGSATHHPRSLSDVTGASDRPQPRMVRKKSGEVVKSSLKRRSTSTPASAGPEGFEEENGGYWEGTKSEPATPRMESTPNTPGTEKKQLRFAGGSDDENDQLAKIVLFKREHKVTAVTRALAGEDVDRIGTDTETETDSTWSSRGRPPSANKPREKVEMDWGQSTRIPRIPGMNLTVGSSRPLAVPEWDNLVLESVSLVDEGTGANATLNLRGSLVARNLSFQKTIHVRYTLDDWQTVSEVAAYHVVHISAASLGRQDPQGKGWDRFAFTVKLEDFRRKIEDSTLLLAIRYRLDSGEEVWDSLSGNNYRFRFIKHKPASPPGSNHHRKTVSAGSAFLPLLESKGVSTAPHPQHSSQASIGNPPSTHAPLNFTRPPAAAPPSKTGGWTFPTVSSIPTNAASTTPPSPTTVLGSPQKLKHYSQPTDSGAFPSNAAISGSSVSTKASPPAVGRPTHRRKGTWDQSAYSPSDTQDVSLRHTHLQPPVGPINIPVSRTSGPSTTVGGLPSPPSSASQSPGSVAASPLPQTPVTLPSEKPEPFDLPGQGSKGLVQPKPRVQPPAAKDFKLPSTSYADFLDKYCFAFSSTSPPLNPNSPPTSLSSGMVTPIQGSGTTSPFAMDPLNNPPSAWDPRSFETIATPTFSTPSPPVTFATPSAETFWGRDSSRTTTPTPPSKPDHRTLATA